MTLLRMRIAPNAWNVGKVRAKLLRIGAGVGMSPAGLEDFVTAVGEAFANAVVHSGAKEPVEIEVDLDEKCDDLIALVQDRGRGIDEGAIVERLPPAAAERGRGIPLMRRCTSSMHIERSPTGGTLVVLQWDAARRATRRSRARALKRTCAT
jgi:anti-sigma regulatory factor (Ser/Thr protein kinase)